MIELQFIYALYHGEEQFFYVGRSNDPKRRFKEHLLEGDAIGTAKQRKIFELQQLGIPFEMKILQSGLSSQLNNAEDTWIVNLRGKGYQLTNEKGGSAALLEYTPSGIVTPWTIDLFLNAEWLKDQPRSKVGEKSCLIKGVQFFRLGQKKLRFIHADLGVWDVFAFPDINAKYQKACLMLTRDTPEHKYLIAQYEQAKKFKTG